MSEPSDDAPFAENHFRALDARRFPDKHKKKAADAVRIRPAQGKGQRAPKAGKARANLPDLAPEAADSEEAHLFLQAVSRVRPTGAKAAGKGQREGKRLGQNSGQNSGRDEGFLLEEHCPLAPALQKKKKEAARAAQEAATAAEAAQAASTPHDEEEAAFYKAMQEVAPLQGKGRDVVPAPMPVLPPPSGELSLQDFMEGKLEFALSFTDEYFEGYVVGLDQMILNKLRAGGLSPEAHLDLHGLNAEQAFEALRGFFRGSWYKGLRTVLVVPGRGRNSPDGMGALREKLQLWLTQEPFKRVVLAFCTAQPHDGGPGSAYVLLRKYRKKGRICWERLPADADLY